MGAFSRQTLAPCRLVLDDYGRNWWFYERKFAPCARLIEGLSVSTMKSQKQKQYTCNKLHEK